MKIIFLDIDGVLNDTEYRKNHAGLDKILSPEKIILLRQLAKKSGAEIVLTSTWRAYLFKKPLFKNSEEKEYLSDTLNSFGVHLYDLTPWIDASEKNLEIKEWLDKHSNIENYVILDDSVFDWDYELEKYFVQVQDGLSEKDVENAANLLKGGSAQPDYHFC